MAGRIAVISPVVDTGAVPLDEGLDKARADGWVVTHRFLDGGPACIESEDDARACLPWLLEAAEAEVAAGGVAALVVNCMCDPGVPLLRQRLEAPVVGPAQACMHLLAGLGLRFSVLDVVAAARREVEAQVRGYGLWSGFVSHRAVDVPVLELHRDRARTAAALLEQAHAAIDQDGAQALLLGCTGFSNLAAELRAALAARGVPVIEPLETAIALAKLAAAAAGPRP